MKVPWRMGMDFPKKGPKEAPYEEPWRMGMNYPKKDPKEDPYEEPGER